jgi:hypothetical protein
MRISGFTVQKPLGTARTSQGWVVKHYRIEKVARPGGPVIKKHDILASSNREAIDRAEDSDDCPICDVRRAGQVVGTVR